MKNNLYLYKARVVRVVSGDALWLDIDLGLRIVKRERIRLTGITAPRPPSSKADECKTALEALCGDIVFVHTNAEGSYGRWTGVLYTTDETEINATLVERGLATVR